MMVAADGFNPERLVVDPSEARDVILRGVDGHFNPHCFASACANDTDAGIGIEIPRLRIVLRLDLRVGGNPVDDGIGRHLGFIHLQIGEVF